ncbi:MAG: hypothetical protein HXY26_06055 [Hydrogenophilaceae bacterium]|nr:hypothetical protein [Hydrogenophilaceae bacterium]
MSHYIHHVPGRLRVKSPLLKRNEHHAVRTKEYIDTLNGVLSSEINTVTGSLVVKYDTALVRVEHLLNSLRDLGHLHPHHQYHHRQPIVYAGGVSPAQKFSDTLVNKLVETALERSATALIAALI